MRSWLRWLSFLLGALLCAWLAFTLDIKAVIKHLQALGSYFLLIGLSSGLKYYLRTLAWQLTLGKDKSNVSFTRLFCVRLAGEAANYLSFGGVILGEPLKVMLLRERLSWSAGLASLLLERAIYSFTAVLLLLVGLLYALTYFAPTNNFGFMVLITTISIAGLLGGTVYAFIREWPILSKSMDMLQHLPLINKPLLKRRVAILAIESRLYAYRHTHPKEFRRVFIINLFSHFCTISEVFIIFYGLGVPITYAQSLLVEALTKVNELIFFFVPAGLGTFEAGNLLIVKLLKQDTTIGLAVAFTRRLRSLFWAILGVGALFSFGMRPHHFIHSTSHQDMIANHNPPTK